MAITCLFALSSPLLDSPCSSLFSPRWGPTWCGRRICSSPPTQLTRSLSIGATELPCRFLSFLRKLRGRCEWPPCQTRTARPPCLQTCFLPKTVCSLSVSVLFLTTLFRVRCADPRGRFHQHGHARPDAGFCVVFGECFAKKHCNCGQSRRYI